ncbi:MAG TPA: ATP-binding protein [Polyangia bacterium]
MLDALKTSEASYRAVMAAAGDAILAVDSSGRITSWNHAAEDLFGYRAADVLGQPVSLLISPGSRGEAEREIRDIIGDPWAAASRRLEWSGLRQDGTAVSLEVAWARWPTRNGTCITFAFPDRRALRQAERTLAAERRRLRADIVRLEQERQALDAQVRRAQKLAAAGQLGAGAVHAVNNSITVIVYCTELLRRQVGPGSAEATLVGRIEAAASRATQLTRQVLDFSRRDDLEMRLIDMSALARELEPMLGPIIGAQIEPVTRLSDSPVCVWGDHGELEQVLVNLVLNARDAMPAGGRLVIETAAEVVADEPARRLGLQPGRYSCLSVSDTGVGISAEVMAHLFEPFFTTKQPGAGTGLGLSTTHCIVQRAGGALQVDSVPGQGAKFTVYLPASDAAATEA